MAARALDSRSRVVCSTDDPEIAEAAREWGAEIPFVRPVDLASDSARSIDVALHALEMTGGDFDAIVLLQPTSPLTQVDDVLGAIRLQQESGVPVVSVCPAEHPAEWLYTIDEGGHLSRLLSKATQPDQRQQAGKTYRANGAVYVSPPASIRAHESFFGPATRAFVMPTERSVDIDHQADLHAARAVVSGYPVPALPIGTRAVGGADRCFVIAEAGVNHNGDLNLARLLVDAAVAAGADAVKFQTFKADRVVTQDAPKAEYQQRTTGGGESQFAMLKRLELDERSHHELFTYCASKGILFLSTPFDPAGADFLEALGVAAFKVPSGEITNLPFIRHVAKKQKPMIVSTGMATLAEVARAVDAVHDEGNHGVALLHCVSNYPARAADANLRAMATLREAFGVPAGYSDHTMGLSIPLAAVALGASVLEKHLTLDRTLEGPDHQASTEPAMFAELVRGIRDIESGLGSGQKLPVERELEVARVARRSLVAAQAIAAGTIIEPSMIVIRRPGTGLAPDQLDAIVGRRATTDVPAGAVLSREMFA